MPAGNECGGHRHLEYSAFQYRNYEFPRLEDTRYLSVHQRGTDGPCMDVVGFGALTSLNTAATRPEGIGVSAAPPFRFYDNRQKYLAFVNTCNEKSAIARRAAQELSHLNPSPPALRIFDAGMVKPECHLSLGTSHVTNH
jgi:hypothetical protein